MPLVALIAAYQESADPGDGLRATLPLAGRTLVERQARLAGAAGASPIIIFVDREPPALTGALGRLRAEGLDILVARSAGEAAKAVQAADRVLLIGDGILPGDTDLARLAGADGPALLTLPDIRFDDRFERIDADSRWAGLGIVDGQMLKHTAAMLQDWDLQSTLLRRAVQGGARLLAIGGDPATIRLIAAERASDLDELQSRILEDAGGHQQDWVSRFLLASVEAAATWRLMATDTTPGHLRLTGLALTGLSALCFLQNWLWPGLVAFLAATPLAGIAQRLERLRRPGRPTDDWLGRLMPPAAGFTLMALAYALWPAEGWGTLVLGAATIAFMIAIEGEGARDSQSNFLAEPKGMGWLMLPFAASGQWVAGLVGLALYAAGSLFWAQRHAHGQPPGNQED